MDCICGNPGYKVIDTESFLVSDTGAVVNGENAQFGQCLECGLVRQVNFPYFSPADYDAFYRGKYPPNKQSYSIKDYKHDRLLAHKRYLEYKPGNGRILDIGSGSGAFVDECRLNGHEAYGCELATYSYERNDSFIYRQKFEDVHFPTDWFALVTVHDVLEHSLDPVGLLSEAFRVTGQQGTFILDFPRFFHESGRHHWKDSEHVWLFTEEQLEVLLKKIGFEIRKVRHPIESKVVFYCEKPSQDRVKILFPPGIGDNYWPLVKMQSFLKREGLGIPDIHVLCPKDEKFKSHLRSFPFVEMFPFVNATWNTVEFSKGDRSWMEAYVKRGRTIFQNVLGCDYFMSYNGVLEAGKSLLEVDCDLECNWSPPRFISIQEESFRVSMASRHGRYMVVYFAFVGTFKKWLEEFSLDSTIHALRQIIDKTGFTPIFAGGAWDGQDSDLSRMISEIPNAVDLRSKTTVAELFGLLRGAELVFGYPSGLTMSAAALGLKTFMIWNDWHRHGFHWNTSPPKMKNRTYFIENTRGLTTDVLSRAVIGSLGGAKPPDRRLYEIDEVRAKRLSRLVKETDRILDVNSGSGAFVDKCLEAGADAYGCEYMPHDHEVDSSRIYRENMPDVHFPTDYFDKVFLQDTFGHEPDPEGFLSELFRVTKQRGKCYVRLSKNKAMNVWFYSPNHLEKVLGKVGFKVDSSSSEELNTDFVLSKPKQNRARILVPPGIGDCYWSLVKMKAFLAREGIGIPDVYISHPRPRKFKAHMRSAPFLEMFPWINSTGITLHSKKLGPEYKIWREAYHQQGGRTIFQNVLGCHHFICYNGILRYGQSLRDVDLDLECDWILPKFVSIDQKNFRRECSDRFGDYFAVYYAYVGTNGELLKDFSIEEMAQYINQVADSTGSTPVFVGADWDAEDKRLNEMISMVPGCENLLGQTTLQQLFGMMKGARAVVGIPSGITIMAAVMGLKTVVIWNDWFNRDFAWHSCPPWIAGETYLAEYSKDITLVGLIEKTVSLMNGLEYTKKDFHYRHEQPVERMKIVDLVKTTKQKIQQSKASSKVKRPAALAIACVLKTGGDFNEEYVNNLERSIRKHLTVPFDFVCLTDSSDLNGIRTIRLSHGLSGWWSKIELFRPGLFQSDRIIYFDLDTLIVGNIDAIANMPGGVYGLRPWNKANMVKGQMASGIMVWDNGGLDFIFSEFRKSTMNEFLTDQAYITAAIKRHKQTWKPIQDSVPGIYSYKRQCRLGLPNDARIVCFHGKPRIHNVNDDWVRNEWSS